MDSMRLAPAGKQLNKNNEINHLRCGGFVIFAAG